MMRGSWIAPSILASMIGCGSAAPLPATPPPKASTRPLPRPPGADAFRDARPGPGAVAEHEYPAVETGHLDNGLSIYVVRRPAGVVSISVVARGGASRVPSGKSGLSALTVRMMTEGTEKRSALGLAEAVESLGTSLEQSAGRDFVRLGMTTLRESLHDGLALLSEVVQKPAFSAVELERVRREWLDSIEAERQSPGRLSALVGLRLLLGTTTGAPVSGSRHDVEGLKRADLLKYYRETFIPGGMALVVVGDVTLADVRPIAVDLLGSVRPRAEAAAPSDPLKAAEPPDGKKVLLVDRPGAVQSALFVAQPFPPRSEPGHEARELLNDLLGGVFTSRLNLNLRETHAYTYGATSLDIATRSWGALAVMTSVRTDVTADALAEVVSELRKARDPRLGRPIADAELSLSRVDLKQHLGATLAHTAEVAERVEELFVHALPDDYLRKYPALLDTVAREQVAAEGLRLDPDHAVIVVVGDKSKVAPQLSAHNLLVEQAPDSLSD